MDDMKLCKGNRMRKTLVLSFSFAALMTTMLAASAIPSERINDSANIESVTSISEIIDPHFYSHAKTVKLDLKRGSLIGMWSPDGSRLLVVSAIRRLEDYGFTSVYVLNADGTEMKEIISTLNTVSPKSTGQSD